MPRTSSKPYTRRGGDITHVDMWSHLGHIAPCLSCLMCYASLNKDVYGVLRPTEYEAGRTTSLDDVYLPSYEASKRAVDIELHLLCMQAQKMDSPEFNGLCK